MLNFIQTKTEMILNTGISLPCGELNEFKFGESEWSIVKLHKINLFVGVVYRSPNSDETNNEKLLDLLSQIRDKVKISNDFNFPTLIATKETKRGSFFIPHILQISLQYLLAFQNYN